MQAWNAFRSRSSCSGVRVEQVESRSWLAQAELVDLRGQDLAGDWLGGSISLGAKTEFALMRCRL
jgi:hypothetical protein